MGQPGIYIEAIISSTHTSRRQRPSVAVIRRTGDQPSAPSATVVTAVAMRTVVRGMASKLVRRKYLGKLWKRSQARGPVNSWQLMLSAAMDQILRMGSQETDGGYQASNTGDSRKMPAMAR